MAEDANIRSEKIMRTTAREFAISAHGSQMYGSHPYSFHLDAVASIASEYGEVAAIVAYLHDVVEDTNVTVDEIEQLFGTKIAKCISVLTDEPGKNRKERKSKTYAKMAIVSGEETIALIFKAADRLANLRASVADRNYKLVEMYKAEYKIFRNSVYRANLCEAIWEEIDSIQNA